MKVELQKEHQWLQRLVGEWTYEHSCEAGTGKPPEKLTGSERVRSLGGAWVLCEGTGLMPDGGPANTLMTLGYNPQAKRFVGTFIGSMMTHLWHYDGALDPAEKVLTLNTEGPGFSQDGKMAKYQDIIEFVSDDHRTLTSRTLGEDGKWTEFMKADYRRTK
jgi:hypothetical protein